MLQVQGVLKTTYYNQFQVMVGRDEDGIGIAFTDATGTAHVFTLPEDAAQTVEDGLAKARTGIQVERTMPAHNGGKASLL